jgi:hypothetical protein
MTHVPTLILDVTAATAPASGRPSHAPRGGPSSAPQQLVGNPDGIGAHGLRGHGNLADLWPASGLARRAELHGGQDQTDLEWTHVGAPCKWCVARV